MKTKIKAILFVFIAVFGLVLAIFSQVDAALPGDEGLTLSPPVKELTLNPGESSDQILKLTNPTNKLVELYPKTMDFYAKGEGGEPGFSSPEQGSYKHSLASWIKLSQPKVALTPEQVVEYQYQINVPPDAEPGGHYGVVFFATEPPELANDTSKVALSSMVGGLVLVRVPGEIRESARIEEFNSDKPIYLFNKVKITTRIKNLGNVHFKPTGTIKIKNIFGRTVEALDFNVQNGNVLPESIRRFENQWNAKKILIGPYKVTADLVYGVDQQALTAQMTLWIIPWWLIIIIVVLIVLITIWIIRRRRKGKSKDDNQNQSQPPKPEEQPPPQIYTTRGPTQLG